MDTLRMSVDMAETAARLAKADLVSQMVYEFPELQGAMGRYYALDAGLDPQIADAIKDHYKPQGPSDDVPTAPVSAAVALADKLDTLVGFWAIDEKPTGSKDPFALRRAALGVIWILLDGDYRPELWAILLNARSRIDVRGSSVPSDTVEIAAQEAGKALFNDLLAFFADRLKVHLKDEGVKHDVIDAVFALGDDDLVRVTKKARALQAFMNSDDGQALLQGYRRAANILTAEEKKGFDLASARAEAVSGSDKDTDAALMIAIAKTADAAEERALIAAIEGADEVASVALTSEDFEGAMSALSQLREPVDAFFEAVVVNAEDSMVRRNRLLLLSRIRAAADQVADFSRLEG